MNKYAAVALDIAQKIGDGTYVPGSRLPTIPELCTAYGVSKITIKRAMDELEVHGFVSRRRGSGTYVKGVPRTASDPSERLAPAAKPNMMGFSARFQARGEHPAKIVRSFEVLRPPADVAAELALRPDAFCYRVERTLYANGIPLAEEVSHLPITLVPGLGESDACASLFEYLEGFLGLHIASIHRRIVATTPTPDAADHLGIREGDSVLKIFQTVFLDNGQPIEYSELLHTPGYEFLSITTQ